MLGSARARITRLPLRASGRAIAATGTSGQVRCASASTAASETISPPTLAKRLIRPRIATKPSASIVTASPVSYQPPGGASSVSGASGRR